MHVTETVASYTVLRKTVDHFSHGSAGWQGLVTENRSSAKTQPCLDRDHPPRGYGPDWQFVHASSEGFTHPSRQKGDSSSLSPPLPALITNTRFPGAREFLMFEKQCFWFDSSPPTPQGLTHALSNVCPIRIPSLAG